MLFSKFIKRDVLSHGDVVIYLSTCSADVVNFGVQHIIGKPVSGNAVSQHAAGTGLGLI